MAEAKEYVYGSVGSEKAKRNKLSSDMQLAGGFAHIVQGITVARACS